ncbi:apolipoprotein N-acyltransferase [Verrucomicrobiaceae bacterium N1E253]|uniref:Apolipoprotein N-acyltransferase n=1 Tax=Oceaniferula marina TaxID=2748318 RepID=A0A851GFR4_9BACT|nr:apolipoprotein N-acyltransferase [Oceaniferula marina]NWK55752.1 apolipoprotein N-acyltransferase [Oceaniferula marina]
MIRNAKYWPWLAAVLSGGVLAMCFPGWDLPGLVWVWMLPLLPAIWSGQKKRYGFAVAYLAGLTFWLINLKWLWTVSGLGAIALAFFLALYFGLWGVIAVRLGNPWRKREHKAARDAHGGNKIQQAIDQKLAKSKRVSPLGLAVKDSIQSLKFALVNASAWVAIECLRGWLFTGFGWNGLGVTFHDTPVLAQAADCLGVSGLAFLPVFMSAVLVQTGCRLMQEVREGKIRPRLDFGVAALLLAVHFCYGVWRIHDVQAWKTERVRVLLVQENIPQDVKWDPKQGAEIIQGYADATTGAIEALEQEAQEQMMSNPDESYEMKIPDLVVWPESAMPTPLLFADNLEGYLAYGGVRHMINEEVRPLGGFTLVAGMNEVEAVWDGKRGSPMEGGQVYNSVVVVPSEGELETSLYTYRKKHLVIFGEYIPFVDQIPMLKKLFEFSAGASFSGNFQAGQSTDPLPVPVQDRDVQLIPSVCFEDTVGRLTRKFVRAEPQLIVNVTNDGWFKQSEAAAQHMANARFRSIELRRPMIRAANTGVSGIVSVTGSLNDSVSGDRQVIENENSHFVRDTLYGHAYLPTSGPLTVYAILGDWFSGLCALIVLMMAIRAWFVAAR